MHLAIRDLLILLRLDTGIVLSRAEQRQDTNFCNKRHLFTVFLVRSGNEDRSEEICHRAYGCIVERLFAGSGNVEYVSSVLFLLLLCPLSESGARSPGNPRLRRPILDGPL